MIVLTYFFLSYYGPSSLWKIPYFIKYNVHTSIAHTFLSQFYHNTLFMNKVGECYLPRIVRKQYFSIIFNEKKCALHSIKYGKCCSCFFVQVINNEKRKSALSFKKYFILLKSILEIKFK